MNEQKQYIEEFYDKFEEKITTTSLPKKVIVKEIVVREKQSKKWSLGIRHVKTKNIDSLLIDSTYTGEDWFFLRDGHIIFLTSTGPIEIKPIVGNTNVRGGGNVSSL